MRVVRLWSLGRLRPDLEKGLALVGSLPCQGLQRLYLRTSAGERAMAQSNYTVMFPREVLHCFSLTLPGGKYDRAIVPAKGK